MNLAPHTLESLQENVHVYGTLEETILPWASTFLFYLPRSKWMPRFLTKQKGLVGYQGPVTRYRWIQSAANTMAFPLVVKTFEGHQNASSAIARRECTIAGSPATKVKRRSTRKKVRRKRKREREKERERRRCSCSVHTLHYQFMQRQ